VEGVWRKALSLQGMDVGTTSHVATPAVIEDIQLSFRLPSVSRKKVTAAFDDGRLSLIVA
jgi:hypothetical protein